MWQTGGVRRVGVVLAGLLIAGCAETPKGGDPGAMALPPGYTCQSVRGELDKLDRQGAQAKVEAAARNPKASAETRATADRYNQLLNYYLGARCHV